MAKRRIYRRYTLTVFTLALLFWTVFLGYLIILDPMQIFHKPWGRKAYFVRDLRLQSAGIINNYPFDSIILGTSMAQNFSPEEASELWRANFVNLSPDGSSLYERSLLLGYALRKKEIKNVIISLDNIRFANPSGDRYPVEDFAMLYNRNPFDDILIYINSKYLFCWDPGLPKCHLPAKTRDHIQTLAEWGSIEEHSKRFGGLDMWFAAENSGQIKNALRRITNSAKIIKSGKIKHLSEAGKARQMKEFKETFDLYLLKYIRNNPGTDFYMFFPPYSRLDFAIRIQTSPDEFDLYTQQIRYIVGRLHGLKNAKVYGFEHLSFLDDIANYKDTGHYHPRFDSQMMRWMNRGEHSLNSGKVEEYIEDITQRAKNYNVVSIGEKIEEYLDGRKS